MVVVECGVFCEKARRKDIGETERERESAEDSELKGGK